MPDHISQRIASLRKLIAEGLHQENIERAVAQCNALSQDSAYVFPFFVLKHVFAEVSQLLEGEAVSLSRYEDLISSLGPASTRILDKIEGGEPLATSDLESLVRDHIWKANVFRAEG